MEICQTKNLNVIYRIKNFNASNFTKLNCQKKYIKLLDEKSTNLMF